LEKNYIVENEIGLNIFVLSVFFPPFSVNSKPEFQKNSKWQAVEIWHTSYLSGRYTVPKLLSEFTMNKVNFWVFSEKCQTIICYYFSPLRAEKIINFMLRRVKMYRFIGYAFFPNNFGDIYLDTPQELRKTSLIKQDGTVSSCYTLHHTVFFFASHFFYYCLNPYHDILKCN